MSSLSLSTGLSNVTKMSGIQKWRDVSGNYHLFVWINPFCFGLCWCQCFLSYFFGGGGWVWIFNHLFLGCPTPIKIHSMGLNIARYKMHFDEYLLKYHDRSFIQCINQYFPANLSDDWQSVEFHTIWIYFNIN